MNRVFDERLELQLQEYEFTEVDRMLPAQPVFRMAPEADTAGPAGPASITRH